MRRSMLALLILTTLTATLRAQDPPAQDLTSAFRSPFLYGPPPESEDDGGSQGWFVRSEALWLHRSQARSQTLSFLDTIGSPDKIILKTSDVDLGGAVGYRITAGKQWNDTASVDLSFFSVSQWSGNATTGGIAGQHIQPYWNSQAEDFDLDSFANAFQHSAYYESNLYNTELNVRDQVVPNTFFLVGLRYLHLGERFSFSSLDEPPGSPNGTLPGRYNIATRNEYFGPQVGLEYDYNFDSNVSLGVYGKTGLAVNFIDQRSHITSTLGNGSGLATNLRTGASDASLAALLELGVNGNWAVCDHLSLRGGYNLLYLSGLALAPEQLDERPNIGGSRRSLSDDGRMFLHGPSVGFDVAW